MFSIRPCMNRYCPNKRHTQVGQQSRQSLIKKERRNKCGYLLNAQAEVEDAVRAVRVPVGPPDFLDEAGQRKAQFHRVALQDVFLDVSWVEQTVTFVSGRRKGRRAGGGRKAKRGSLCACSLLRCCTQLFQAFTPYRWLTLDATGLGVMLRSGRPVRRRLWTDIMKILVFIIAGNQCNSASL